MFIMVNKNIVENLRIKDKNNDIIVLENDIELFDNINKVYFKTNYEDCYERNYCWCQFIKNILNGNFTLKNKNE